MGRCVFVATLTRRVRQPEWRCFVGLLPDFRVAFSAGQ